MPRAQAEITCHPVLCGEGAVCVRGLSLNIPSFGDGKDTVKTILVRIAHKLVRTVCHIF